MLNIRAFVGGRMTAEMQEACLFSKVNSDIIDGDLFDHLRASAEALQPMDENGLIRRLSIDNQEKSCLKSHLAVLFRKKFSTLSKILSDPDHGTRSVGRPRLLTQEQEAEVVTYIRACQLSGHAATFREATTFINDVLLENSTVKVSDRFVSKNTAIMKDLDVATPQLVEELRVQACNYENLKEFYERLQVALSATTYDLDLIINVDETSTHAEKTKKSLKVLFDPELNMRPITTYEGLKQHVTLSCGISASGKRTLPCFIIKNKTVTVEQALKTTSFDHGNYALQYSINGWQDKVSKIPAQL
jgi:hypothetical protein